MPDMSYNTTDGNPPMSLVGGGSNVAMPQPQAPQMANITVPTAILNHPAVQQGVQLAQADMAKAASSLPLPQPSDRIKQYISDIQAMKDKGLMTTDYQQAMQRHPILGTIANGMMAFGQGITRQPFYSDFQAQQNDLVKQRMQDATDIAKYGTLTPEQQFMNNMKLQGMQNTQDQRQNQLEAQAIGRVASIRGDTSLGKIEQQRDAATSAYNTLQTAEHEGRLPNQVEFLDILGQLWKARTGTAPTDQVMKEFNVGTVQQNLNKVYSWATGKPAPANTKDVIGALKDFVVSSGKSLDQQHESYFSTHLIKPKGLEDDRWEAIKTAHRGNSFEDATKQYADSLSQGGSAQPTGTVANQATAASGTPFQVGQQYNGYKILSVQQVK